MLEKLQYQPLAAEHFQQVLMLANKVHGDQYLTSDSLAALYKSGIAKGVNASWVAINENTLSGFRLTQAAGNWSIDHWCTPQQWLIAPEKVCYFKCNTVEADCRGLGIGSRLLQLSIGAVKQQGGQAGLAHIWLASPGNSAFKYFSKAGGVLVKKHPNKWQALYQDAGCPVCSQGCQCEAGEMLLTF